MVIVNGRQVSNIEKMTLKDYLTREGYILSRIAVECNGEILPREVYGEKQLQDGDSLEVISFVGGG